MFEQTFVTAKENARKPYSMALSLILQILIIGAFSLLPLVLTQSFPSMQLKSVLAAPRSPSAPKVRSTPTRVVPQSSRIFRLSDLLVRSAEPHVVSEPSQMPDAPQSVSEIGVPDGAASQGVLGPNLAAAPQPAPAAKSTASRKQGPIRVGTIAAANLIHMVQPSYPSIAIASRLSGSVEFTATISKDGSIENLQLVRGHPLFIKAAQEAVLQWRYRPTLLNGEPVEVITDIVVNFVSSVRSQSAQ